MTATATNYDRVHKARKTAPLLEHDDIARMKAAVKTLERERDKLNRELLETAGGKAEALKELQANCVADLVRIYRELQAGRSKHAMLELERVLDRLDNSWGSIT